MLRVEWKEELELIANHVVVVVVVMTVVESWAKWWAADWPRCLAKKCTGFSLSNSALYGSLTTTITASYAMSVCVCVTVRELSGLEEKKTPASIIIKIKEETKIKWGKVHTTCRTIREIGKDGKSEGVRMVKLCRSMIRHVWWSGTL